LAPATVWGPRISLQQGNYTFEKGYSPLWDANWFVTLAVSTASYLPNVAASGFPRQGHLRPSGRPSE
jgi:cytosine/uracil/thiamine/allantoin permease